MSSIKKEKELAKYKNLLSINSKALNSVSTNEEAFIEYEMPLEAMQDIVNYLEEQVTKIELEIEEMLS
jgi:hypothetical protein